MFFGFALQEINEQQESKETHADGAIAKFTDTFAFCRQALWMLGKTPAYGIG